jgi:membrane-associated protein
MEWVQWFFDVFMHLDRHLGEWILRFDVWIYGILFLIIFCETGLVVTPVLPGDSLLFAVGAFTVTQAELRGHAPLDLMIVLPLLSLAAILGDTANYWIGHKVGPKVFRKEGSRLLNRGHLERAHQFYEKYGGITIIIARFMPFIRTFAPFVAGIGAMTYWRFLLYNVVGGIAWISSFALLGHFFYNLPAVKKNFTYVILAIVVISVLPMAIGLLRGRKAKRAQGAAVPAEGDKSA